MGMGSYHDNLATVLKLALLAISFTLTCVSMGLLSKVGKFDSDEPSGNAHSIICYALAALPVTSILLIVSQTRDEFTGACLMACLFLSTTVGAGLFAASFTGGFAQFESDSDTFLFKRCMITAATLALLAALGFAICFSRNDEGGAVSPQVFPMYTIVAALSLVSLLFCSLALGTLRHDSNGKIEGSKFWHDTKSHAGLGLIVTLIFLIHSLVASCVAIMMHLGADWTRVAMALGVLATLPLWPLFAIELCMSCCPGNFYVTLFSSLSGQDSNDATRMRLLSTSVVFMLSTAAMAMFSAAFLGIHVVEWNEDGKSEFRTLYAGAATALVGSFIAGASVC